jgi:hypothetical protein
MRPELVWIAIAVLIVVAIAAVWFWRKRRSEHLRARFGPEYDRTVDRTGGVAKAEAVLEARAKRVERLHIRPLTSDDAVRFADEWRHLQAQFVDDPKGAVTQGSRLVDEVLHARGYPVGDFEQRVEDISVDHPNVVMNYRAARDIAQEHERGGASTEDLRQAMVHYRALFQDLLEIAPEPRTEVRQPVEPTRGRG